jgi:hypothetical protein
VLRLAFASAQYLRRRRLVGCPALTSFEKASKVPLASVTLSNFAFISRRRFSNARYHSERR